MKNELEDKFIIDCLNKPKWKVSFINKNGNRMFVILRAFDEDVESIFKSIHGNLEIKEIYRIG